MRSTVESNPVDHDWNQVSTAAPCPICGGGQDCRTHADEAFACCVQEPSDWRLSNGGWLHRVEAAAEVASGEVAGDDVQPNLSLRESGVVVRGRHERWSSDVAAAGSST